MNREAEPVLIGGRWRPADNPLGTIQAVDPATAEPLAKQYPISSREDILVAIEAGAAAARGLRDVPSAQLAGFLDRFAELIEQRRADLVALAERETGLPAKTRLNGNELPRTTNQLRLAAQAVRDRSWTRPVIDTQANIRSLYGPLGAPVVVLGPNNFPFAFNSVSGGDSAAALAAGNPVIAKAHPGHPGTTQLLAELALQAVQEHELPSATVQLLYHMPPELGLELVAHPAIGASAFTGSRRAGLQLKAAADQAGKPIYLEMSSVNPVFVLPGALQERAEAIAGELFSSCTLGTGQFCTNPGLVVLPAGPHTDAFVTLAAQRFSEAEPGLLLNKGVLEGIQRSLPVLTEHGAEIIAGGEPVQGAGYRFANTLLRVSAQRFLEHSAALQTEVFGPVSLLVTTSSHEEMAAVAQRIEGSLTGAVYSHTGEQDEDVYRRVEPILRTRVGRLLNDKMPTGVAVSPAMNHGGPYPSTGHPGFTAVGIPASLTRFAMLYGYDQVRPERLPAELRDENPQRIWRLIDGAWTRDDVRR